MRDEYRFSTRCALYSGANEDGGDTLAATRPLRHPAQSARRDARRGRGWYALLARTGLVAKGLSFGLVGALAIKLAAGGGGKATSREGALASLAQHGFGKVVLSLLALGFAAYASWRFVQAFAEQEESEAKEWGKRAGYAGRGLIYAALTVSTVRLLLESGRQESQNARAHKTASTVLSWPGGTWVVGLAGALIVGAGLWNAYRGITRKFQDRWRVGELGHAARAWGARVGVVGHLARAVVFTLIGVFVIKAAIDYNPKDAIGLDGALQKLAHAAYGPWLLGLTAAGLVAYGAFCLVDAKLRDVSTR
jgi:hypothetical protein